jgi:hypothetical protein
MLAFGSTGASSSASNRLRRALRPPGGKTLCDRGDSVAWDALSLAIRSAKDWPVFGELEEDLMEMDVSAPICPVFRTSRHDLP